VDGVMPLGEAARLVAVRRYEILDRPPDGAFDTVCELAATVCQVPIATVTIVDEDRIWFAAAKGLTAAEIPREAGLCASAVMHDDVYVVSDAVCDPRTLNNSLVRGELGLRFYAGAPIVTADGYRLGTVNIIDRQSRQLSESQADTLRNLARLVAEHLELRLAALHTVRRERQAAAQAEEGKLRYAHLAETLQRSLSPPRLPLVPDVQVAAVYHPASSDDVGGDFYDFFALHDGSYAIFVGDVCGKGARAAALTSLTRYTLRGAAIVEPDPAAVLAHLNAALLLEEQARADGATTELGDDDLLCTAVYAHLYPPKRPGGSAELLMACAGHPEPLLTRRDGTLEAISCGGPIAGVMPDATYTSTRIHLHPGDTLLLYTDGVTDAHTDTGDRFGVEGLTRFLGSGHDGAVALIAGLDQLLATFRTRRPDDVAALALTVKALADGD
jgi:sigma-B regulation protein RsbU (phosphoserine phosphatase)